MPDEDGICRCGGAGWDGCSPERQAIERRRAALRRAMAEIEGTTAGQTLLDYPPPPSLLANTASAEIQPRPAPLAVTPALRWPSAELEAGMSKPQLEEETHLAQQ